MTQQHVEPEWQLCPAGTLKQAAREQRVRSRRRILFQTGGAAAAALFAGWLGGTIVDRLASREPSFGGITCSNVRARVGDYMAGTLDQETSERIRIHLDQCEGCQAFMREMQSASLDRATDVRLVSEGDRECAECRRRRLYADLADSDSSMSVESTATLLATSL